MLKHKMRGHTVRNKSPYLRHGMWGYRTTLQQ